MKNAMLLMLLIVLLAACAAPKSTGPQVLRVMTHDSFNVSEEVIAAFETEHNVTVQFLKAGDTGTMLNQAILSKENPQADVIYGIDNTFLSRALEADIALPLKQVALDGIPENLRLDPENRFFPVDYGDVCLNYDKETFESTGLAVPQDLTTLTLPEYKGLLVVQNPASSSPGLLSSSLRLRSSVRRVIWITGARYAPTMYSWWMDGTQPTTPNSAAARIVRGHAHWWLATPAAPPPKSTSARGR